MPRILHALQLAAIVISAALGLWASSLSSLSRDVTDTARHSLHAASRAALDKVTGPLELNAYLPAGHAWRAQIEHLAGRYVRARGDVSFRIIDPTEATEIVRRENIGSGEILIRSGDRSERTSTYTEQSISDALVRLARAETHWVVFLSGHGERSPRRGANYDLSEFARSLEQRGISIQELDLAKVGQIPSNTSVLVLASPRVDYLPGEIRAIENYIESGGNFVWFMDPDVPAELHELAASLELRVLSGTVIDPTTLAHGIDDPAVVLVKEYADHLLFEDFDLATVFFHAIAVDTAQDRKRFEARALAYSSPQSWNETNMSASEVAFDEMSETKAALPLGQLLVREHNGREQRIVIFGDGDFLANSYLNNSGNQDLGVRTFEWLVRAGSLIDIPVRIVNDRRLELQPWHQAVMGACLLFVLPLALVTNGVVIWWRRRRA